MWSEENGVVTTDIHLTPYIFREALRAVREQNNTRVMRQILARHWTHSPSIDPDDIIEVASWEESEAKREGFAVKAIVRVALGQRRLSNFLISHVDCMDELKHHYLVWAGGGARVRVECSGCGNSLLLSRESLEGNIEEREADV